MKCKACGAESGKYPLCRVCNIRKEKGEIVKCFSCGNWHLAGTSCPAQKSYAEKSSNNYLYDAKQYLISRSEDSYFSAILSALPNGYHAFPQVNLASFVVKNDDSPFHNELFRNVDFLVTNERYAPLFVIEINDRTHLTKERKERDEKVQNICEEAGIPVVRFWTTYGVNQEYISQKISETIQSLPVPRVHHFSQKAATAEVPMTPTPAYAYVHNSGGGKSKSGCYIATCVYGSYDCPEVWTLRRFRDGKLASSRCGRWFIKCYYCISPTLVKWFGKWKWFHKVWKPVLDSFVRRLTAKGYENTPYQDKHL